MAGFIYLFAYKERSFLAFPVKKRWRYTIRTSSIWMAFSFSESLLYIAPARVLEHYHIS